VEEIEILSDAGPDTKPRAYGDFSPGDMLKARLGNIEHSLRALEHVPGTFEEKLKAYRQLLEENDEYLFYALRRDGNGTDEG